VQPSHPGDARTIQCPRCHGHFSLDQLTAAAHCPYCGLLQQLDARAEVREARDYERQVQGDLAQANQAHEHAAAWERWYGRRSGYGGLLLVYLLCLPLMGAGSIFLGPVGPVLGPAIGGGVIVGYSIWYYARSARRGIQVSAGTAEVACPRCGAPSALAIGRGVDTCAYCHASLMPSHTVMMQGLDAARLARRRATMERHRQQRSAYARMHRYQTWSQLLPYVWLILAIPVSGGMLIYTAARMLIAGEPFDPARAAMGGAAFAVMAGALLWWLGRRRRARLWQQAMRDLAAQLHGQVLPRARGALEWLNAHWAGEHMPGYLRWSGMAVAAALDGGGYRTLVDVDPVRSNEQRTGRALVLLAAWVPGISDGTQGAPALAGSAQAIREWLARAGFSCAIGEAGIMLEAGEALQKKLRRNPAAAHGLAPVIMAAAELAGALGAEPVDAA
jgi:DNA-directed RNA polymerase subunit RPC12/RpoP